jgi:hypothetical protein
MPPGPDDTSPAPAYRLSITVEGGLLRAQVDGEIDAQAVRLAYWREIVDAARAHQCRLLLVIDRKKTRPASSGELAALALAFRAHRDDFDRIGVFEPTAAFVPAIEHAEIHGRALGINVRIFSDPVEAERWVRFGSADD